MAGSRLFAVVAAVSLTISGMVPGIAAGQTTARTITARDARFVRSQPMRIVVLRPDVEVGSIGIGGVEELNADWTVAARSNLARQIEAQQHAIGNEVVFLPEQEGENGKLVAEYGALFRIVAQAAADHRTIRAARLPTKRDRFDWTLGPGAAKLAAIGGGDYALFVKTHDAFGTGGRKAFRLLTGGLMSVILQGSGIHRSFAALVDLRTGDFVWFTVDPGAGGDPRTEVGATKRVGQLFGSFATKAASAKFGPR